MGYLVLKVPSVRPTYVFTSALSSLVTVARYTTPSVKYFPDSGQVSFLRQLQSWVFVMGFQPWGFNHPPSILRRIPEAINRRPTNISSDKQSFDAAIPPYQEALKKWL